VGPAAGSGSSSEVPPGQPFIADPQHDEAAYLFDQTQLRSYNIAIASADLAKLDSDPWAEQYVPAMLEFEGKAYGPFAVRYKGSFGAFEPPCTFGSKGAAKSGKCSIKLSFNETSDAGRFFGLKKLNLHAMGLDSSMLHERLGYSLYRDMNIPASRAVHARVYINGALEGLFAVVEQVDGRFTRARFGDGGEGNLYKEIWPMHDGSAPYAAALETHVKDPQVRRMVAFKAAVDQHTPSALGGFIDRAYVMRYSAVDRVMMNDDGAFHFWCGGDAIGNNPNDFGNHNYYWYEQQNDGPFWLLPWDLDVAFNASTDAHIKVRWDESAACECVEEASSFQKPSSCDALVQSLVAWKSDYDADVDAFLAGPFADDAIDAKLDAWLPQMDAAVRESAGIMGAPDYGSWQAGVAELRSTIASAREHRGFAY
jgi:spore coat protein CotH